jgi:hypothetical protein
MTARKVYIVTYRNYHTGASEFRYVFFTREAAEKWIVECTLQDDYEISVFEEGEEGTAKEVYE